MFPPTSVGMPAFLSRSPIRVVVVVLPFEPVIPTIRPFMNLKASSTSPITSPSFLSTYRAGIELVGTPGEITTRSIWSRSQEGRSPPTNPTLFETLRPRAVSDHSSTGFRSCSATVAPRSARNLADAIPDLPAPKTIAFRPSISTNAVSTSINSTMQKVSQRSQSETRS